MLYVIIPEANKFGLGSGWTEGTFCGHWWTLYVVIDGCTEWSLGLGLSHFGWTVPHGRSIQFDGYSMANWVLSGSLEINFKTWQMVHGFSQTIYEIIHSEDQVCGYEFWLSFDDDGHSVRCRQNLWSSLFMLLKFDSNLDCGWSSSCMFKRFLGVLRWHIGHVIARFWSPISMCNKWFGNWIKSWEVERWIHEIEYCNLSLRFGDS
jgi:hypothetical protein